VIEIEREVWVGAFFLIVLGSIFLFVLPAWFGGEDLSTASITTGSVLISFGITIITLRLTVKSAYSSEEKLNTLQNSINGLQRSVKALQKTIGELKSQDEGVLDEIKELKTIIRSINETLKEFNKKSE